MPRKSGKYGVTRPGETRKRTFHGNRFTDESDQTHASTSAAKISKSSDFTPSIDPAFSYCIVQFLVITNLQQILKCKACNGNIQMYKKDIRGLGFKLNIKCDCAVDTEIDSCPKIGKAYEINRRIVYVFRLLGVGLAGLQTFCGTMDLGKGISEKSYYDIVKQISIAVGGVFRAVIAKAADEEKEENKKNGQPERQFAVSGDGSWAKRGFSSLVGIVSLIGKRTYKIIDLEVKSSYCIACRPWKGKENTVEYIDFWESHKDTCSANHTGSAGKMEVDGVNEMFERSEDLHDAKYKYYIGDGDTKTFTSVVNNHPYGPDFVIEKKECVLHVKKECNKD